MGFHYKYFSLIKPELRGQMFQDYYTVTDNGTKYFVLFFNNITLHVSNVPKDHEFVKGKVID